MARGSLVRAWNPSSAIMARLRDARQQQGASGRRAPPIAIMHFCRTNCVDRDLAAQLMAAPPDVAAMVVNQGALTDTRNPRAALASRLLAAEHLAHQASR